MNQKIVKGISFLFLAIIIANLVLFGFRLINDLVFWGIIISCAIFAYVILPKINNKEKI